MLSQSSWGRGSKWRRHDNPRHLTEIEPRGPWRNCSIEMPHVGGPQHAHRSLGLLNSPVSDTPKNHVNYTSWEFKSDYIQLHPRIHRYMHINKDPCCTLTIGRFMWQTQSRPFRSHYHPSQIGVYPILSQTWGLFIIVFTLLILDS